MTTSNRVELPLARTWKGRMTKFAAEEQRNVDQLVVNDLAAKLGELQEEVREFLAYAGCESLPDVVGKIDSLQMRKRHESWY